MHGTKVLATLDRTIEENMEEESQADKILEEYKRYIEDFTNAIQSNNLKVTHFLEERKHKRK